jgi:hypothetical protein
VAVAVGEHVVDRDVIGPPVGIAAQSQMRVRQVGAVQRRAGLEARAGNYRAGEVRPGGGLALGGIIGGLGERQTRHYQGGGDDGPADHATKPRWAPRRTRRSGSRFRTGSRSVGAVSNFVLRRPERAHTRRCR